MSLAGGVPSCSLEDDKGCFFVKVGDDGIEGGGVFSSRACWMTSGGGKDRGEIIMLGA